MMHFDRYPPAAAGVGLDDVRQEITAAEMCGKNPAAVVPAALGLRRLHCRWKSKDPAVAVGLACCIVAVSIEMEWEQSEPVVDATGLAPALIGGTEAVATLSGIGWRAAQVRVNRQLRRELGGDLFGGALHD